MDQTRFVTLQKGIEVAKDLELPRAERLIMGETFILSLLANNPFASGAEELKPLDIIVDRMSTENNEAVLKLANDDLVVETTARLEPQGPAFKVSIFLQLEEMVDNGARVYVSKDMEKIILAQLERAVDRLLAEGLEM